MKKLRETGVYRNRTVMARLRLAELFNSLQGGALAASTSSSAAIYRRRMARASAGIVGAIGGVLMLVASGLSFLVDDAPAGNVIILAAALLGTAVTYVVSRYDAGSRLNKGLHALVDLTDDVDRDLERLEATKPMSFVRDAADRVARLSVAAPLAAIALLGPLTAHLVVGAASLSVSNNPVLESFGVWMAFSAAIVGHAHLVLAVIGWRYARRLLSGGAGTPMREGLKALGWTVLAACVPGLLLIGLPPLLTAFTGAVIVLPAFHWANRTASLEHALLHEVGEATPA